MSDIRKVPTVQTEVRPDISGQAARQPKRYRKRGWRRSALGFGADVLAAALLFASFYAFEYGIPFVREVYAVAETSSAEESLPIQISVAADSEEQTALTDGTGTAGVSTEADSTSSAASDAVITDNSYSDDNLSITVTQYSSGSGNSKITWYVADIQVKDLTLMDTCFAEDTYGRSITDTVLDMAAAHSAILAVNGDYYSDQKNNIVIRNGTLYQDADITSDLCVLYKDGTMKTYSPGEIKAEEAIEDGAWQAWNFGPELLASDGSALTDFNTSGHVAEVNPRTAIGYYEPGHYCLVVVDGRSTGYSRGMTLNELAQLFSDLGCTAAYNLDGGKSSVMVFNGNIVNQPCDGGREVSDAITVG